MNADELIIFQLNQDLKTLEQQVSHIEKRLSELEDTYARTPMESTSHGSAETPQTILPESE